VARLLRIKLSQRGARRGLTEPGRIGISVTIRELALHFRCYGWVRGPAREGGVGAFGRALGWRATVASGASPAGPLRVRSSPPAVGAGARHPSSGYPRMAGAQRGGPT
jgi:hypothetical protein